MDKRLYRYNLKKLNHGKKHNLNRFITLMKQNHFLKTLPTTKSPETDGFSIEFYNIIKEELAPMLLK